jgi:flagella synthesis protein FlgN
VDHIFREQLEHLLQREAESVQGLAVTLTLEFEALEGNDADSLNDVVSRKEQQLAELNNLANERTALLQHAGFDADRAGFAAALDADDSGALRPLWEQVEAALLKCQQQNEINGKLLDVSKQQTQELLSLMLGKEVGGTALYDQSGNTATTYNRNTSIKV